ncbi:hypothetical protein Amir_5040 [Actinosynnema mirum DSM 43827]|uniref:Uncharacterized protein n=1 Tax=Actinosynnema mirum (strain ATCC 29888 / DSM 43827 / JCM 3225 / NBRC 14064 / NCIMB 13271 / NRRL B-12336 / IMRU 3971 / 101) TaxID=446462 RepID=C6WS42_ACTMD|nr:hypothetical protein Amir_5040 [Actinosynnema mirum DSM 43827]
MRITLDGGQDRRVGEVVKGIRELVATVDQGVFELADGPVRFETGGRGSVTLFHDSLWSGPSRHRVTFGGSLVVTVARCPVAGSRGVA